MKLSSIFYLTVVALFSLSACQPETDSSSVQVSPTLAEKIITDSPSSPPPTTTPLPTATMVQPTATQTPLPYTSPDWFQDAVIYEIFVRSFADSDEDGIGDLQGITNNLDYIASLGADTIWLMPIHPSPSQHGYDVIDYFAVNPQYGDMEDLQTMVDEAHARGMRVILDFVPSHLSDQNPLFAGTYGDPTADNSEWFVWTNDAHTLYATFAGIREMPRFNHYNPEVVDYLIEAALFWLDLDDDGDFTDGIDGFRVDNATFPPQEFLMSFRQGVKSANPDALILGETWVHNPSDLSIYFENQFDALFDFPLYEALQGNRDFNGDGILAGDDFPVLLTSLINQEAEKFPPAGIPVRFLSNHDTNRIATELKGDAERLRLAAALQAALPGPQMIYYGEEIGMLGQKGGPPEYDNYRREPMDWYADQEGDGQTTWFRPDDRWNQPYDGISVEEQDDNPDSLLNFYRRMMDLRHSHSALLNGDFEIIEIESSGIGPWGFLRRDEHENILALYNFASEEVEVTLTEFPFSAGGLVDLISGREFPATTPGDLYVLKMTPSSALLLTTP